MIAGRLAPSGTAGFVMANSVAQSLSSSQSGEGDSRKNIIEGDLVECVVASGQLFYTRQIRDA